MSTRPTYTDPDIRSMAEWRPAARAAQQAMEAVGREIARQRIAGAPDAVLAALGAAMLAIPYPEMPRAEGDAALIAAAPGMLAALRDLAAHVAASAEAHAAPGVADSLRRAVAAIARAEGGVS